MPVILNKYYPPRNIVFFIGEGALIFFALSVVYFFFEGSGSYWEDVGLFATRALLVTLIFQLCLYYFDLYDLSISSSFIDTATRITQAFGVGCIVLGVVYFIVPKIMISTEIFFVGYLVICGSIAFWRIVYAMALDRRMFTQPIMLLGLGSLAEKITGEITGKRDSGYKIVAYVGESHPAFNTFGVPVYSDVHEIPRIASEKKIEKIIVALDDRRKKTPVKELMKCKLQGVTINRGVEFYESLTGKLLVEKINPDAIIYSEGFKKSRMTYRIKRLVDIVLSAFGLLVSFPITLLCALIIKCESPGPVFYTQERVGAKGKTFKVIKFRSMRADAEKNGPVWAARDDARITKCGRFIRLTRIDEIPQLWNVFRGEMSFVGPRPERPVFVEQLEKNIPYYSLRHDAKPGITGLAQICYPYGASEEDALRKLEYDLYYLKNISLRMDLWIIFETVKTVLFQKGSR